MAYIANFISSTNKVKAHTTVDPLTKLHDDDLILSINDIDSFSFTIHSDHPQIGFINEMKTLIEVIDLDDNEIIFEGRILNQTGETADNITTRRYIAEDCIAFLHDSRQMPQKLHAKPSEILRFMINRHNSLVEPYKQFAVGTVEIDTYRVYGASAEAELVAVVLKVGDTATIKPTTQYIYDWDGTQLPIADYAKGVAHKVSGVRTLNGIRQYQVSRTWATGVTTVEGFINESDIVEAQATVTPEQVTEPGGELLPGTKFKIREGVTTYYGASDGGGARTIPSDYLTYTYSVSSHGLINGMYGLVYQGTIIAWLPASDVVQVDGREFEVVTPPTVTEPSKVGGRYPEGTRAKIKPGVTTYYWSADGTGPTTIPQSYRTKSYTVREWSSYYKRYAIYTDGYGVAWINESDLDFGTVAKPSQPIQRDRPAFTDKIRLLDVELSYSDNTYDAIKTHLLDPLNAEMEWELIEGVRTIHIRKRIEHETNETIRVGLNLISSQTDINPADVTTVLIPIGRPIPEESETDGS